MKKYDTSDLFFFCIIGFIVGLMAGVILITFLENNKQDEIKKRAIESDLGQYNPKTGNWEWISPKLNYVIIGKRSK